MRIHATVLAVVSLLILGVVHGQPPLAAAKPTPTSTLQLRGIHILVKDVPQTVAFYERAFGASLKYMHPTQGYAELATGDVLLAFISEKFLEQTQLIGALPWHRNRPRGSASGGQLVFISTRVVEDFARAVAAGAVVIKAPESKPWGQTVGYLRDLNGYMVELCSPQTRQ